MRDERSSSSILRKTISEPQAQWFERLTSHQKVAGLIWGSEIIFVRIELSERSSLIQSTVNRTDDAICDNRCFLTS